VSDIADLDDDWLQLFESVMELLGMCDADAKTRALFCCVQVSDVQFTLRHMDSAASLSDFPLEHWSQIYLRRVPAFVLELVGSSSDCITLESDVTTEVCRYGIDCNQSPQ
jgi:hypothetical protein